MSGPVRVTSLEVEAGYNVSAQKVYISNVEVESGYTRVDETLRISSLLVEVGYLMLPIQGPKFQMMG